MELSVIIVSYYSREMMRECVQSIFDFNDLPDDELEVIVVENSPLDEALAMRELLVQFAGKPVKFIRNDCNRGYGGGNNAGIKQASGKVVAVMNPDIRLHKPLFKRAVEEFKSKNTLAMLGFKQIGNQSISYYLNPEFYFPLLRSFVERVANRMNRFNSRYFFLSGAFVFFDRQKFWDAGGFDEAIFLYMEEADISHRIRERAYSIQFIAGYSYLHLIDERVGFTAKAYRHLLDSLSYYCEKYNFNERKIRNRMLFEHRFKKKVARLLGRVELEAVMNSNIEVLLARSAGTATIHVDNN